MQTRFFDVIVVGAGIAGTTAATLYARDGHRVALLERSDDQDKFKQFCTHFIQAGATPTIRRLGLDRQLDEVGAIKNVVDIWSSQGWVIEPPMLDDHGEALHGYSVRRSVLDPMLRDMARATPGLSYLPGIAISDLIYTDGRITGVLTDPENEVSLQAPLVVAADGRQSRMAKLASIPHRHRKNRRGGVFAHYRNIRLPQGRRSLMWFTDKGVAYIFANDQGIAVVTAMPDKSIWSRFETDSEQALLDFVGGMPDAPDLSAGERVSEVIKMKNYPNQSRSPVFHGMALIGDAALSADPLFGIGCGWAFQSAEWLVNHTSSCVRNSDELSAALGAYAKQHRKFLGGHMLLIADYSRRKGLNTFEKLLFGAAARDREFAEHFYRFVTRTDSVGQFLAPDKLLRALSIKLFSRLKSPGDYERRLASLG